MYGKSTGLTNPRAKLHRSNNTVLREREEILTCRPSVDNWRFHGDDSFYTQHSLK